MSLHRDSVSLMYQLCTIKYNNNNNNNNNGAGKFHTGGGCSGGGGWGWPMTMRSGGISESDPSCRPWLESWRHHWFVRLELNLVFSINSALETRLLSTCHLIKKFVIQDGRWPPYWILQLQSLWEHGCRIRLSFVLQCGRYPRSA